MAAQLEEIVIEVYRLEAEHVGANLRQRLFNLIARCQELSPGSLPRFLQRGKQVVIDFSVNGQRELFQVHEDVGQGFFNYGIGEENPQLARLNLFPAHVISDQDVFAVLVPRDSHHTIPDLRMTIERGYDLGQLHAKAVVFDLMVYSAEKFDIAVWQVSSQVPGSIHSRTGARGERVRQESIGRKFRAVEIASGHPFAGKIQLSRNSYGDGHEIGIENVRLEVGDGFADWNSRR